MSSPNVNRFSELVSGLMRVKGTKLLEFDRLLQHVHASATVDVVEVFTGHTATADDILEAVNRLRCK